MKKLCVIYLLFAAVVTLLASCSYQNYNPADVQFAPLTNNSYTANTGWNADHYNVAKCIPGPIQPLPLRPVDQSTIITAK